MEKTTLKDLGKNMPESNYSLKFSTKASEDLEQIYIYIAEKFIVFYLANEIDKQVIIMRILFGSQNYQDILF